MVRLVYTYAAAIYCEACGDKIKEDLRAAGKVPDSPDEEHTFDSDDWPKGPDRDGEADNPQHCGSGDECLDPLVLGELKYGCWLENTLTQAGVEFVRESREEYDNELVKFWVEQYEKMGYTFKEKDDGHNDS